MFVIGLLFLLIGLFRLFVKMESFQSGYPKEENTTLFASVKAIEEREEGDRYLVFTERGYRLYVYPSYSTTMSEPEVSGIKIGNRIRVRGEIRLYDPAAVPGQFDARTYYRIRNIRGKLYAKDIFVVDDHADRFGQSLYLARKWMKEQIFMICGQQTIYEPTGEILSAMLLGERHEVSEELKNLYSAGGIAHILAISGLHLSLLGMTLLKLLRRCRFSLPFSAAVCVILMGNYVVLVGAGPSAVRAYLFFVLLLLAEILGRGRDMPTACVLSYAIMITIEPLYFLDVGFHMSFSAVGALCLVHPVLFPVRMEDRYPKPKLPYDSLKDRLCGKGPVVIKNLWKILGTSLYLQLFMLPVTCMYYYEMPISGAFLNVLVLPTIALVLYAGMIGLFASAAGMFLPGFISGILHGNRFRASVWVYPAAWLLRGYEKVCHLVDIFPKSYWRTGKPSPIELIGYVLFLFAALVFFKRALYGNSSVLSNEQRKDEINENRNRYRIGMAQRRFVSFRKNEMRYGTYSVLCLLTAFLILSGSFRNDRFYLAFLDVGQGDCTVIHDPAGMNILVDCGSSSVKNVSENRLVPYLKHQGISKLDYVCVTHGDEDHVNGIRELLKADPKQTVSITTLVMTPQTAKETCGKELMLYAELRGCDVRILGEGDALTGKDENTFLKAKQHMDVQCLYPDKLDTTEDCNNTSMVLAVSYIDMDVLLMGDLEERGEENLLLQWDGRIELIKAGHHGSAGSSSEAFLDHIRPETAIFSCGRENSYGHPHRETLERMAGRGIRWYRTDLDGSIEAVYDGKKMTIRTAL